jgi:putative pyruvate formate lyase activating enzyme
MEHCAGLGSVVAPLAWLGAGCAPAGPDPKPGRQAKHEVEEDKDDSVPGYVRLHRRGQLKERGEALWKRMAPCKLCPRTCGVDRPAGEKGFCQAGADLVISSHHPHFGEEPPLVGKGGSGTVFFSHCGLRCVFCINYEISLLGHGRKRTLDDLANMMLELQEMGCHNLNVVTPSHYSPYIVLALDRAVAKGFTLPLVYNTCGWENMEILAMLDGVVDIYLADFKYACGDMAAKYSTCVPPDTTYLESEAGERYSSTEIYPQLTQAALLEMNRQVGVARPGEDGLLRRGLIIRHLVMPNSVGGTADVLRWIAKNLPKDTYVNLMSQYTPTYRANEFPDIARRITREEYQDAVAVAEAEGLTNVEIQGYRPAIFF